MSAEPPDFTPPPEWQPVIPFPTGPRHIPTSPARRHELARGSTTSASPGSDHLYACVWFGHSAEGPPDSVHGGAIAAVLDEAMGAVCWMNQHPVVGARITINYRHMVPLGFAGRVESWIDHIERRKCFITSRLTDADGKVYAEGEALFVKLTPEQLEASIRGRERRKQRLTAVPADDAAS